MHDLGAVVVATAGMAEFRTAVPVMNLLEGSGICGRRMDHLRDRGRSGIGRDSFLAYGYGVRAEWVHSQERPSSS